MQKIYVLDDPSNRHHDPKTEALRSRLMARKRREVPPPGPRGKRPSTPKPARGFRIRLPRLPLPQVGPPQIGPPRIQVPAAETPGRLGSLRPVVAYFLGPLGVLASSGGRQSPLLTLTALATTAAWWATLWFAPMAFREIRDGSSLVWLWALASGAAVFVGFHLWAHGVALASWTPSSEPGSRWFTNSWVVGILGFLAPGLGLALIRHPWRAAWVLRIMAPVLIAGLILANGATLWSWSRHYPSFQLLLEWIFLGAGLLVLFGFLVWVVQALDGWRLAPRPQTARFRTGGAQGDLFAAALLVSLLAFAFFFKPAGFARQLDHFGVSVRAEGLRFIPSLFFEAAVHLDPAQSVYVIHAAELEETLGNEEKAASMRRDLEMRLQDLLAWERRWEWNHRGLGGSRPVLPLESSPVGPREWGATDPWSSEGMPTWGQTRPRFDPGSSPLALSLPPGRESIQTP